MAAVQEAPSSELGRKKNARWSKEDDATLVNLLTTHQSLGHQSDNGWKSIVWTACEEALQGSEEKSGGGAKTTNRCKEHWLSVRLFLSYGHALTLLN